MVCVDHTLGISVGANDCASPSHLRNATWRAWAMDDARRSQKSLMVTSKLKSRFFHHDTRRRPRVFVPAPELMNGLPVRVREVVERIRCCCLPYSIGTRNRDGGRSKSDTDNLRRHQLFSDDHAKRLDPEIRQWLPRIVCPAFPFSTWCQGGEMLGDAMLYHIETCEGFKTYFPREHEKLFSSDPKPPLKEARHLLNVTFGQLELLKNLFGEEGEAGQGSLAGVSAEMVEAVLHSWRPIVKPDVEEVLPSEFPPVRIPSFFGLIDRRSEVRENTEDVLEVVYPELYLPPELLHPTTDPAYIAAAVAAHTQIVDQTSPLIPIPFPSIQEEIPWDCFQETAAPMNTYESMFLSLGGNAQAEEFHIQLPVAQNDDGFAWAFT